WFLWYITHLYHISIKFFVPNLHYYLIKVVRGNIEPEHQILFTFISWFHPLTRWLNMIDQSYHEKSKCYMFSLMIFEILILIIERFRNSFANSTMSFHLKYGLLQM
ncbi:hypothetical protein Gogos_021575, partial [Gossypium gossypioides]|nr:hypothetical protein [Gossypium gossypioides]